MLSSIFVAPGEPRNVFAGAECERLDSRWFVAVLPGGINVHRELRDGGVFAAR
jgi:hypothetical protein